jgi:NADPH:quinone reductase-like Zn-dependent oxidoreductase
VLQLKEIATPAPADDEVLVRLLAASVNPLDWHLMRGDVRLMSGGLLKHDTRSSALTSQGELKRLAET